MHPLQDILSLEDVQKLGLSPFCIPPYIETLPENFSDLPSIKRMYIEKALCELYSKFTSKYALKIVIFTWVIGDGLGDFSAQIETAKVLCKHLPSSSQITLISLHPKQISLKLPPLPCQHYSLIYEENQKKDWNSIPPVTFPKTLLEILKSSHLILQIPTYYPWTQALLKEVLNEKGPSYELVGEAGWGHTPRFSPISGSRSLGLHFWEKGLFLPEISTKKSLSLLKDPLLKKALLTDGPPQNLCTGYLRNPSASTSLLQTFLEQNKENKQNLTLCLFPSEGVIRSIPSFHDLLQTTGIKQVNIYYENSFSSVDIQKTGKILTIIQAKKIDRDDYQILLNASHSLVGCRGDGSLSEVLSYHKIPFFDFPAHKRPLLQGLLSVSKHLLSENHDVSKYVQEFLTPHFDAKKIGQLAKSPQMTYGFQLLSTFIKKHYSIEDFIKNLTLRALCHHFHPELLFLEKIHLDPFLLGSQSAFQSLQSIKNEIDSFSN